MRSLFRCLICLWVVALLFGCSHNKAEMLSQLEELEAVNRSGQPLLNDTLAESLVEYFDRHGDSNERMRAKYMLGRTYFCLGELPRALEAYNEAVDCVDTTSVECDFAKLSRVYAQKAAVYYEQIQARSQLHNLRLAEYYARKANDSLQAIECHAQQADAYDLLQYDDSILIVTREAESLFGEIERFDRASQVVSREIIPLLRKGEIEKVRTCINIYESYSTFIDKNGNIAKGKEIFYYLKGKYYLYSQKIDSAEFMFRRAFIEGEDLNSKIAGCKGLQEVYERRMIPDSIAKYASLGYELNDSAYSLSEMQNIQKFQASYDYNHHKYLAKKERMEAQIAWLVVTLIIVSVLLLGFVFMTKYRQLRIFALDYRLRNAKITRRLKKLANSIPPQYPTFDDWHELRTLVEQEIPTFSSVLNIDGVSLSEMEYDICLMIRVKLLSIEISKLKGCSPSYVSNIRKRLLQKIFKKEGGSEDFDDEIGKIGL